MDEEAAPTMMTERDKILAEEMNEIWRIATPMEEARLTERVLTLKHLLQMNVS